MKTINKSKALALLLLSMSLLLSCGGNETPDNTPATVETLDATDITDVSAICMGKITLFGSGTIVKQGIELDNGDGVKLDYPSTSISKDQFSVSLKGLAPSHKYSYRAFVDDGTMQYGQVKSFTTLIGSYNNPVIGTDAPDPSVIRAHDGKFYLYHTGVGIHRSDDLVNWTFVRNAFTTKPNWEPGGGVWAPDINYINGQYVMYYSLSVWGGEWTCGIGIATSSTPEGPFTDRGKLFRSNEINVQNSIDPCYIEENGKKYLFWGSFRGIYVIELSENGLAIKEGAVKQQVAGTAYEGVYIHKRGNYYYMFASWGSCCNGFENSSYTTVVGRSSSLLGPYLSKSGGGMMNNNHEILIRGNDDFKGTGHNSELITDNNGNDWIFYHAYKKGGGDKRMALMDKVTWVNDWPVVNNGTPSSKSKMPLF